MHSRAAKGNMNHESSEGGGALQGRQLEAVSQLCSLVAGALEGTCDYLHGCLDVYLIY